MTNLKWTSLTPYNRNGFERLRDFLSQNWLKIKDKEIYYFLILQKNNDFAVRKYTNFSKMALLEALELLEDFNFTSALLISGSCEKLDTLKFKGYGCFNHPYTLQEIAKMVRGEVLDENYLSYPA